MDRPVFAPPSVEGVTLALERSLLREATDVDMRKHCAVVIDVTNPDGVLIQRAISHADVDKDVRDAFREAVDRHISQFADAQELGALRAGQGDPYRSGPVASNEIAGFDVGYAAAVARERTAKLRASLRAAADLCIQHYAVPFLVVGVSRDDEHERHVVLRRDDGAYVYETIEEARRA